MLRSLKQIIAEAKAQRKARPARQAETRPAKAVNDDVDWSDPESIERRWSLFTDKAARPREMPAWAMTLTPPFDDASSRRSWLGGLPVLPPDVEWPCGEGRRPLSFAGQIDLSEIQPEPQSGLRPDGLPTDGAMLMFFGDETAATLVFNGDRMENAVERTAPNRLGALKERGFWIKSATFPHWPVRLHPYLETKDGSGGPSRKRDATDLIVTWADATVEAEDTAHWLRVFHDQRSKGLDYQEANPPAPDRPEHTKAGYAEKLLNMRPFVAEGLGFAHRIEIWARRARAEASNAPVDRSALTAEFAWRRAAAETMPNYPEKFALESGYQTVWSHLQLADRGLRADESGHHDFTRVPPEHRESVAREIGTWGGHRLFGQGWIRDELEYDLRGLDAAFTILGDPMLKSQSEHESGFSGWFTRPGLAEGENRGLCTSHINV